MLRYYDSLGIRFISYMLVERIYYYNPNEEDYYYLSDPVYILEKFIESLNVEETVTFPDIPEKLKHELVVLELGRI